MTPDLRGFGTAEDTMTKALGLDAPGFDEEFRGRLTEPTTPTGRAVAAKQPVGEHWLDGVKAGLVLTSAHELADIEREAADEWQAIAGALAEALRDADHCHPLESRCLCGRWNTEDCEPDPKGTAHAALARFDAAKERPVRPIDPGPIATLYVSKGER